MFRRRRFGLLLGAALWTLSAGAQAQNPPQLEITYEGALALARQQAPSLAAARARAREAESRIEAASVFRFNPQVSAAAGPRFGAGDAVPQWSVGVQQWLELGGQRGDRIDAAEAGAAAGAALRDDAQRRLLRDVSLAFISALYWQRRVGLAEENLRIAEALSRVAARRNQVGDGGGLQMAALSLAVVQARSADDRARASLVEVEGRLKGLLGVAPARGLSCRGDLRALGMAPPPSAAPHQRPDLRALRASMRQAASQAALGRANRVPNVAVGAGYAHEESDHIVQATLTVALPVFDDGSGLTHVAEARGERLRTEHDATRDAAAAEVSTAQTMFEQLSRAARRFEQEGLPILERSERIATASYEAGAVALDQLLAARRQLLQAKVDYAELLLAAATARTEQAASTGALR